MLVVIILAAGEGTRMRSDTPKVLHLCGETPMLVRVIRAVQGISPDKILLVTGRHQTLILDTIRTSVDISDIIIVNQYEPRGTGHAVQCCLSHLNDDDNVFILNGDIPLIQTNLLQNLSTNTIVTAKLDNVKGYGRILYENDKFISIIEEKDCSSEQLKINEINCGIYLFSGNVLKTYIPQIRPQNNQNEYYLTDIVKLANDTVMNTFLLDKNDNYQIKGVNTPQELNEINEIIKLKHL